jgi:hypothetical protein
MAAIQAIAMVTAARPPQKITTKMVNARESFTACRLAGGL